MCIEVFKEELAINKRFQFTTPYSLLGTCKETMGFTFSVIQTILVIQLKSTQVAR